MRVGYYQFRPRFGRPGANTAAIIEALRRVRADLIVLPELALTGYNFAGRGEARELAEVPGRSLHLRSLADLCRDRRLHLVLGFAEKARDKIFNSSVLLGPRGVIHVYRKLHLFMEEKRWFDPGDRELRVCRVGEATVGMMICFDWFYPEVARILALQRADLLAHPSNLVLRYCQDAMTTRCLENNVFAVTANRFGEDRRPHGSLAFTGASQVTGPKGEIIHRGPARRRELFVTRVDLSRARTKRPVAGNDLLRDRRPRFYGRLLR